MKKQSQESGSSRREFIGAFAANTALLTVAASMGNLNAAASPFSAPYDKGTEAEAWIEKIKGSHKMVFDCTQPHEIYPFAWPRVFLMTNTMTGAKESDCCAVVVLRHDAIPYAMENSLWAKYNFGEVFHANDPKTGKPSTRNPFWQPGPDDFVIPGIGPVPIGIDQLQKSGALFCVCDAAMTVYSNVVGGKMNMDAKAVKEDWVKGLLPGIQPVPSGVWALGRAQEKGCGYVFTG